MKSRATNANSMDIESAGVAPSTLRLHRRELFCALALGSAGLGVQQGAANSTKAHELETFDAEILSVELPPNLGQLDHSIYVSKTGHTLQGSMLDYWRATGAASVYGNPISEPFAASNGVYSQAFKRGIFQYHLEALFTADPIMHLMPLDFERTLARTGDPRAAEDLQSRPWRPLSPTSPVATKVLEAGGLFDERTGHTISDEFLDWYRFNEGSLYLGSPLTEPFENRGTTVQHFEGGLLQQGDEGVELVPIIPEIAGRLGIDTTSIERDGRPEFDELHFWEIDNPNPLGDPYAPGPKWIQVSVPDQRLWAYQGTTLISSTLVSTGIPPNETERGLFHVSLKYPEQDLGGFTDETGEVLGFGDAPPGTIPYSVEDVPDLMYFNMDAEALHGTYWHNNFGNKMSHGCVNLPLEFAQWLYGWAPLGTAVWVHD